MSVDWSAIGQKLKVMRLNERRTQGVVAEKAGVTQATVSKLEAGGMAVSIDALEGIAKASGGRVILDVVPEGRGPVVGVQQGEEW